MFEIFIFIKRNVWDWQSIKKIKTFEIFSSWNTLYLFLYIQLVFYNFTHLTSYRLCFQVITTTTFPFLGFPTFPFFVFVFTTSKKKIFLNIFSIDLILLQVNAFKYHRKCFFDYQINLGNTANLNSSLYGGGDIQYF